MKSLGNLVVLIFISGCVEIESYPDTWSARMSVADGSCPDISGQYGFIDSEHPNDFQSERALRILHELSGFEKMYPLPNKVEISHNRDEWLSIQIFVDNRLTHTQEFTNENATIRCDAIGLFIKPQPLKQTFSGGGQTIRRELLFSTTQEGSIVFREKYTATSRILVIPVAGFGIRWHYLDRVLP